MSPVGSTLVSRRMTTGPPARRRPMFVAAAWPRRSLVQTTSTGTRPRAVPCVRREGLERRRLLGRRPVGDDDDGRPVGRVARSPPARGRGRPASPWRSARPSPGRPPARRTATARWCWSRTGSGRPRAGRPARPGSARNPSPDRRSSSPPPRSRRAVGRPPPSLVATGLGAGVRRGQHLVGDPATAHRGRIDRSASGTT